MTDYELITGSLFGAVWLQNLVMGFSYGRLYNAILTAKRGTTNRPDVYPPVTLLVTAHNQAHQLRKNLPLLLEQEYAEFEVIVMDECSIDETNEVLAQLANQYRNLRYASIPKSAKYISKRKLALTLGIRSANYDWLLFTKADCKPQSKEWLSRMASNFQPGIEMVIGYANYEPNKSLFGKSIRFDRLYQTMDYLYAGTKGKVYRGSGCNLAYRKELFEKNRGFTNFVKLKSGEDDLFVNETATPTNTRIELHPDSFVYQAIPNNRKDWQLDKLFYMETRHYLKHKFSARITYWLRVWWLLLYYLALATSLFLAIQRELWFMAIAIGVMHIVQYALRSWRFNRTARALGEKGYRLLFSPFEETMMLRNGAYWLRHKFYKKSFFMRR